MKALENKYKKDIGDIKPAGLIMREQWGLQDVREK